MSDLEKYNHACTEAFGVGENELASLKYQGVASWDSVGHMNLIGELEDAFDIEMETDDVIGFSSYEKGREILKKYGIEI